MKVALLKLYQTVIPSCSIVQLVGFCSGKVLNKKSNANQPKALPKNLHPDTSQSVLI